MMLFLLLAAVAASGLPDPASFMVGVEDTVNGLLFTDGRHTGLFLACPDGETRILSVQPGAGRNVVVTEQGVLFKECPFPEEHRVVFRAWNGGVDTLYRGDCFSGPFAGDDGSFLVAERGRALELSPDGRILSEMEICGYPASLALTVGLLFFTGESGGLGMMDMGTRGISFLEDFQDITFSGLTAGPEGNVLAEISPCGFLVLDPSGDILLNEPCGLFPSWADDGEVICSRLEYSGLEPAAGSVIVTGTDADHPRVLSVDGVPLYPLLLRDGTPVWTGSDGKLRGTEAALPPLKAPEPASSVEADAHFDVVYMHQKWDTPDWFNGSWSCGPTSCLMTTQYYLMLTPDSIWASYPSPGHWSLWGNYIPVEYTFLGYTYDELGESPGGMVPGAHGFICPTGSAWWNLMVEFLVRHGIESAWAGTSWSTLTAEINSLYPVVCSSSVLGYGHIILFNGYFDDHTVVVNDPFGDANEPGWGSYYNGKDVLYDWPGYNNGHVQIGVSQLFYARAPVPSDPDTLVDDCSRGFFKYADCCYWHLTGSGFQGNAWWTYSTGAPPDTCIAEWHPVLPCGGNYEVSVYIPPDRSTATGIYRLHTGSVVEDILLDQGLYSDEWVSLGTYGLEQGSYLRLGDFTGTGGQYIAFDAARFSPAGTGVEGRVPPDLPELRLWPNPCAGVLNLHPGDHAGPFSSEVYDTSGRLVLRCFMDGESDVFQLDLSTLCSGIYIVQTRSEGGTGPSGLLTICR